MKNIELDCKYVTVEVKKFKTNDKGELYEVVEKKDVPDFVAEILTGKPVLNPINTKE